MGFHCFANIIDLASFLGTLCTLVDLQRVKQLLLNHVKHPLTYFL